MAVTTGIANVVLGKVFAEFCQLVFETNFSFLYMPYVGIDESAITVHFPHLKSDSASIVKI